MSGKLDQSLDEILSNQRRTQGRRRSQRRTAGTNRPAAAAPAGGIQKNTKPARGATKPTPAKGAGLTGESKIMVSNLVSRILDIAALSNSSPADAATAQGCIRRPDQGMFLPMRPLMPSDSCRRKSPARVYYRRLLGGQDEGVILKPQHLKATVMMPQLLPDVQAWHRPPRYSIKG